MNVFNSPWWSRQEAGLSPLQSLSVRRVAQSHPGPGVGPRQLGNAGEVSVFLASLEAR